MAITNVGQKSICLYHNCRNKELMFAIKEVWDGVSSPENQFFNISRPSTSSLKVSLSSDEVLMSYYLFMFSPYQHVQYMASQNLLILIDFDSFFI